MGRKKRTRRMKEGAGLALLLPLGPPVLEPNLTTFRQLIQLFHFVVLVITGLF